MNTTTINVSGMTCGHCVNSVTEELTDLKGVQSVSVNLNTGGTSEVTITSTLTLDPAEVSEAVAEAGYTVVANNA
ncbi:heavy-metal-associated domain-containing protein [Arthrobacter cryoconiti]|uniref:Heavy-metal-associated domain-containing protein n=1 Tax=Arthrobacter cryoconiti TaxID=748907 RepID=A0ABV8R2T3_9MICC|nr:heavy-metal-associated domain-containing protein [Arthrobacter cryoconiti]MCC9067851.1 heavy-metal-associated domain-containing protein [Arthrobacter cryoconiti]